MPLEQTRHHAAARFTDLTCAASIPLPMGIV